MDSSSRGRGFGANNRLGRGRGAGGRGRGRGRGNGNASTKQQQEQTQPVKPAAPAEKYIVVISNVENDLARVHQDRLPAFLGLDLKRQGAASRSRATKKDEEAEDAAEKLCYYDLVCRSETRSAELNVYGPADADVSSIFAPSSSTKGTAKLKTIVTMEKKDEDPTATKSTAQDISEDLEAGHAVASAHHAFRGLTDMAAVLASKPYFTHHVGFHVNLPGKEAGETLPLSDSGSKRLARHQERWRRQQERKSAAAGGKDASAAAHKDEPQLKKRARTEAEDGSSGDDNESSAESTPGDEAFIDTDAEAVKAALVQFPSRQKDLVTAVAVVSAPQWTAREVKHHLKDLPGFLSCWKLYAKHFRVVFQDKESLFKAKQLLDQFHLDGNVRVAINLSDALTRLNSEYLAKEDAGTDEVPGMEF